MVHASADPATVKRLRMVDFPTMCTLYVLEGIGGTSLIRPDTMAPVSMKSLAQAAFQLSSAGGSVLALALTPTYRDPDLMVVYASLAGCMFLTLVCFVPFSENTTKGGKFRRGR